MFASTLNTLTRPNMPSYESVALSLQIVLTLHVFQLTLNMDNILNNGKLKVCNRIFNENVHSKSNLSKLKWKSQH